GAATLVPTAALSSSPYQLELITGSSYHGVSAAPAAGSSTTPTGPAPTSTTAPPPPVTAYQLPGSTPADASAAAACQ
ncbi:MAG: hypothetical protein ACRDZY_14730, partial [Acidimicrobiales bacterium]